MQKLAKSEGLVMRHRSSPIEGPEARTEDLFRSRLEQMIDLRHPLVRLSEVMPWKALESELSGVLPPAPPVPGGPPCRCG